MDCEHITIPIEPIDYIVCFGMLHRLDISHAFPEMRRILKDGCQLLAAESLGHNPVIRFYRNRTPELRTEWRRDHILSEKDINLEKQFLRLGEVRYWHFLCPPSASFRKSRLFQFILKFTNRCDRIIATLPLIFLLAWQIRFGLIKKIGISWNTST